MHKVLQLVGRERKKLSDYIWYSCVGKKLYRLQRVWRTTLGNF